MKAHLKKIWHGWPAALVAVPVSLGAIELFAEVEHLHFVLFPSTAAVALSLFTAPTGPNSTWRSAVLAPTFGAFVGVFAANELEPGFLEVKIVVLVCMLGMRLMGVTVPAVLACAIVPLFAGPDFLTLQYPAAVLLAKVLLFVMFTLWRRTRPSAA